MRLRRRRPQPKRDEVLVRVAPEILELLKDGTASPVVILGVNEMGDGTHEMILRSVEQPRRHDLPSFGSVARY